MKLALTAVEEAADSRAKAEDIKDAVENSDLAEVAQVDLDMAMKEKETIGAVDKIP